LILSKKDLEQPSLENTIEYFNCSTNYYD